MAIKYEYGTRLWEAHRFEEAVVALQEAQQNPKHRVDALHLLGRSFLQLGMAPEAVDTLKKSIDEYELAPTGDRKSKELHYWYARALEQNKQARDATVIYSKVVQWEMSFYDAKKRLNELRGALDGGNPPA
jgi:tetratricopeptide (TPR) repeat protein